ncbi:hybrid sensor histidine kinase/response regulator [Leucothrix sargassi]|nr:hybrid sensor histidine kinase/response regulator [Leucothrix sargassi]
MITMLDNRQDVANELEDVALQLADRSMQAEVQTEEQASAFCNDLIAEFERIKMVGEMMDFAPLADVSHWLSGNAQAASSKPETMANLQVHGHFFQWAELLATSLRQEDTSLLPLLSESLQHEDWPVAIPVKVLEETFLALMPSETDTAETPEPEPEPEEAEDASLLRNTESKYTIKWDDDVHPEILSAFLSDTPDQIAESTALIHKIANGSASKDEHKLAARLTHTIKGASGVIGVTSLIAFTHQLEEILEHSVEHNLPASTQELLSASADCLDDMGEAMLTQKPLPDEFEPLLDQLEKTALVLNSAQEEMPSGYESSDDADEEEEVVFDAPPPKVKRTQKPASPTKGSDPLALSSELLSSQELFSAGAMQTQRNTQSLASGPTMRVPVSLIDNLLNLAEELVTSTSQVSDSIQDMLSQSNVLKRDAERTEDNMAELEQSIDLQFKQVQKQNEKNPDIDELDLEVYNELHSAYGLLDETLGDTREIQRTLQQSLRQLNDKLHSHQRINRELNATILNTRMVSLESLTPRLERIVRETCRSTGKKANLNIVGSNLAVDTDILKGLTDPLLHLLRNAVDHGIEAIDERTAQSKDESGNIELSFKQEGRYVIMTLKDDGAGIDAEAIYQRALSLNLVDENQALSHEEKLELILLAGFSTRSVVSNISGRGVGMDVVQDAVSNLRGNLSISSKKQQGTEIRIRLPLTLVAANTIMVTVAGNTTAIPVDSIDRLHTIEEGDLQEKDNQFTVLVNDKPHDVIQLSSLLGWGNPRPQLDQSYPSVLVTHRQKSFALIVDAVLQPREVVVKSLAPWLSNVTGLNGACLLSDGAVAAVLDLPRLLGLLSENEQPAFEEVAPKASNQSLIMIVDDSLSNRRALRITAEQLGYNTITAIDGQDALDQIKEHVPDLILSDLEMPRVNGLDFATSLRADDMLAHIPFIMITSRATNKHRKQAKLAGANDYLIKPVDRETLQNHIEKWLK